MNVEIGRTLLFCLGNNEAAQFHIWEYINRYWILTAPFFAVQRLKPKFIRNSDGGCIYKSISNGVEGRIHNYGRPGQPACYVWEALLPGYLDDRTIAAWDILWRGRSVTGPFVCGTFCTFVVSHQSIIIKLFRLRMLFLLLPMVKGSVLRNFHI
jgi:hypothetical protein